MKCPYCLREAKYGENKEVYGRNYGQSYMCYYCKACDAYVGTHNNTTTPLGTMANKELREMRIKTHKIIDFPWKQKMKTRREVYKMLKKSFGYPVHIGKSDLEQCKEIIKVSKELFYK